VWSLRFSLAAVSFLWVRRWDDLILLLIGVTLPQAIKKSAAGCAREHAREDEEFYNPIRKKRVLTTADILNS
jgi:hypothetical protein